MAGAEDNEGESRAAAGEAAAGARTGSGDHNERGGGVLARFGDNGRDVGGGDNNETKRNDKDTTDAAEEGSSGRNGGGGVVARFGDDGQDVGRGDNNETN